MSSAMGTHLHTYPEATVAGKCRVSRRLWQGLGIMAFNANLQCDMASFC